MELVCIIMKQNDGKLTQQACKENTSYQKKRTFVKKFNSIIVEGAAERFLQ